MRSGLDFGERIKGGHGNLELREDAAFFQNLSK